MHAKLPLLTQFFGSLLITVSPADGAVSSLPTAPLGYEWELITSAPEISRDVIDTSSLQAQIEADLGITGSTGVSEATQRETNRSISFAAFGSPEPASYEAGDIVQLILSNKIDVVYGVCAVAGAHNPSGDNVFLQSIVGNLQVSTSTAGSPILTDHKDALDNRNLFMTEQPAHPRQSWTTELSEIEGEMVTLDFEANSEVSALTPFGGSGNGDISYFGTPVAEVALVREARYEEYRLVPSVVSVPEPAASLLLVLTGGLLVRRKR